MLCPRCGSETPPFAGRCENCGVALIETQAEIDRKGPYRIGDVAAERYELRERLPTSPLYWSFVAFDQEDEHLVFLKVVRQTILPRTRDHKAFVERVEPLRELDLSGVARLLRVERDEGKTLVISEFIDGLSLRAMIDLRRQDNRAFSASETLSVLTCVAESLEAAAPLTAHGDLRPSHVMILDETLKLEALGLAQALPREETIRALRDDTEAVGYLAPEVLEGHLGDPLSDRYSFAIMAGELLSGRVPPAQGVGMDEFLQHLLPLAEEVIQRNLAHDMKARTDSPQELVAALSSVLGAETWKLPSRKVSKDSSKPTFSKDPSIPAEPDESGTIPMASPFEAQMAQEALEARQAETEQETQVGPPPQDALETRVAPVQTATEPEALRDEDASERSAEAQGYQPPSPSGLSSSDADETQKNEASDVARAVEALEKDPRIAVQPAAEGTVQITADMIEPDSELIALVGEEKAQKVAVEMVEKAASPISMQSPAENTLQITDDMLESVEEGVPVDAPGRDKGGRDERRAGHKAHERPERGDKPKPSRSGSLPGADGSKQHRGEDLDPRLVRAAKHLDMQRHGKEVDTDDAPAPVKVPAARLAKPTPAPAPKPLSVKRPATAVDEEENITTTIHRSERKQETHQEHPSPSGQRNEPSPQPKAPEDPAGREPIEAELDDLEETVKDESPPNMASPPEALLKGSLGPIEVKVAGGNGVVSIGRGESRSPDEPQSLPAVMVDQALTEAFGHAEFPMEPTHRVARKEALRPTQIVSRKRAAQKKSLRWVPWVLFVVLLTGLLTLLGLGSLWLLN